MIEGNDGKRASGWFTIEGLRESIESDNEFTFYFKTEKRSTQKRIWNSSPSIQQINCFNNKGEIQTGIQVLTDDAGKEATVLQ